MKDTRSIVYLNFSPYENAGRILDYILAEFPLVILFSFSFHQLNKTSQSNSIKIWRNGKLERDIKLFLFPTIEELLFITLPIIAFIIVCQTIYYIFKLRREFGKFDIFLTVNAFTAWIGNILRGFGAVKRTIFWVWDYYSPDYDDWRIRLARWAYWRFDVMSTRQTDTVVFLNPRLAELRQKIGVLSSKINYRVVPIGTNIGKIIHEKRVILGHFGVLKKSQGLDLLFEALPEIQQKHPEVLVEIVGSGPDAKYFQEQAKDLQNVHFYGFVQSENEVDEIIRHWSVGIATYVPEERNPAHWTDPSKIKAYISQGVPVVSTKIVPIAERITKQKAGVILKEFTSSDLAAAVETILNDTKDYKENAFELAKEFSYKTVYHDLFRE